MTSERSWPHRFRVTIHTNGGTAIVYPVVSWRSQDQAVALAVTAHQRRHPDDQPAMRAREVNVDDLGPVGRDAQGAMALEGADIIDRMEF
jgi:virulence-associated protein VagC